MIKKFTYTAFFLSTGIILASFFIAGLLTLGIIAAVVIIICISIISLGVLRMQMSFFSDNICKIPISGNWVALTFDDGPHPETARLLDILDQHEVKASFFCIGKEVEKYPEIVARIVRDGHSIGSHTFSHSWKYTFGSFTRVMNEIRNGIESIARITGEKPQLFRPPFGITNPIIGHAIKANRLKSIGWNIRTYDTTLKNGNDLFQKIANLLQPGVIILMHDRLKLTVDTIPRILEEIRKRGLTPITLDEALKDISHV